MSLVRFVLVALFAPFLSGCLNSATLVRVKPDGSGTLEQTLLVNTQAFKGLLAGLGGSGEMKQSGGVLNEAEFKRSAERMGVRPVSLTPLKEGGFEGAKALYAFEDITRVRVDQDPQMSGGGAAPLAPSTGNPIRFALAKGPAASLLTISFDEKATAAAASQPDAIAGLETVDPAMLQMVKAMFEGFKIAIDLEVDGTIVKTTADYVSGSRVTLLEVDMGALLQDEARLKALQSKIRPGASISELKPFLKDVKGVKINHPTVTIEYR